MSPYEPKPPRKDGICCECLGKVAVTTDGRFCRGCLRRVVNRLSPGKVSAGPYRDAGRRQAVDNEPSPWQEDAIKAMEG